MFQTVTDRNPFRTKKKSFDLAWTSWVSILTVAVAAGAAFTAAEVMLMHSRKIRFLNVRVPNLEDLRQKSADLPSALPSAFVTEAFVDKSTPVFLFTQDYLIIGSLASVVAPSPQGNVLLVSRQNWQSEAKAKISSWPQRGVLFPNRAVAIGVTAGNVTERVLADTRDVVALVTWANQTGGKSTQDVPTESASFGAPAPFFVSINWQQ